MAYTDRITLLGKALADRLINGRGMGNHFVSHCRLLKAGDNLVRVGPIWKVSAIVAVGITASISGPTYANGAQPNLSSMHEESIRISPEAKAFLAENQAAMERMMGAMHQPPTGDVDKDFVSMMIPHHQGAIDMARAVLRSSRNEKIRRLAQEIIITQQDEIRAMRMVVEPADALHNLSGTPGAGHK